MSFAIGEPFLGKVQIEPHGTIAAFGTNKNPAVRGGASGGIGGEGGVVGYSSFK
jgi:hypothetical protein